MFKSRSSNSKGITIEHLWLAAPFFVIFLKGLRVPLPLLDFWWHLKMGEIIVATRSIPRTDLFSFTAADQPFIVHNWLAEIAYFAIHWLGGLPLLIFLNAVLLAITLLRGFPAKQKNQQKCYGKQNCWFFCFAGNPRTG